jgi:hypothetical protein
MVDVTASIGAFVTIMVILAVFRTKLPRCTRFTLIALEAVIIFFTVS